MVRTKTLRGEHSFRGAGFVEIDGILYPVCGSRKFDLSVGGTVRYREGQLELVKPEETRRGIIRARLRFDDPPERWRLYTVNQDGTARLLIDDGQDEEGLPSLLRNFGNLTHQMTAPFRIRYPGGVYSATWSAPSPFFMGTSDPYAPFIEDPNMFCGDDFLTEIFIPE